MDRDTATLAAKATGQPASADADGHPRAADGARVPLGQLLVELGVVGVEQVARALEAQRSRGSRGRHGGRLGDLLCEAGHVRRGVVVEALVRQSGLSRVNLAEMMIQPEAPALVPADVASRHLAMPFAVAGPVLSVAMADPFDRAAVEVLRVVSGKRIERHYAPEPDIREAIRKGYGSNVARMIANLDGTGGGSGPEGEQTEASVLELQELAREPSVVNLVNLILLEAVEARASDVHIEPFEKTLRVKYRIDGLLQEVSPPPRHLYAAIASRIKIMGGMDIAERFVPQDGHIAFQGPRGTVDVRVGTVPTVFGESVALRLLDRSVGLIDLERIGFPATHLAQFCEMLEKPHGIVLVTGPTGSGKTTTLYASLGRIYTAEKKIITIEDPVEYQLDGVNQIPVNRKRGVDFAGGLRAILRQDPDIIMVGEVRDRETADIAIRSALTGHLVFSTLHTNDAAGAVTRLLDMGVEPFLLASSLEGILAQRLVRSICEKCRERYEPPAEVVERITPQTRSARLRAWGEGASFYRGTGCRACRETGYAGRTGLFELLRIDDRVRGVIHERGGAAEILAAAGAAHQTMREHGLRKAAEGVTTLEEVLRVTQDTPAEEAMGIE